MLHKTHKTCGHLSYTHTTRNIDVPVFTTFAGDGVVRTLCTLFDVQLLRVFLTRPLPLLACAGLCEHVALFFSLYLLCSSFPSPSPLSSTSSATCTHALLAERASTGVSLTWCLPPPPQGALPRLQPLDDSVGQRVQPYLGVSHTQNTRNM